MKLKGWEGGDGVSECFRWANWTDGEGRKEGRHDHTTVIQMLAKLHIPMSSCCDVEVSLDFIPLQTAENSTRIGHFASPHPRRLGELLASAPHLPEHVPNMLVFLLCFASPFVLGMKALVRVSATPTFLIQFLVPQRPGRFVFIQHVPCQDPISSCILHVDVEVVAAHGDDDVEVELERVCDATLDAEVVGLGAAEPGEEL